MHYLGWAPVTGSAYGWLGVDLFFVLSGFLITSILLGLRDKENRFKSFYSRRALRIFPPYFLGIAVYFSVSVALGLPGTLRLWIQYVFYYMSLYVHDPLPPHGPPSGVPWVISFGLTVLWSLSVEEIYCTIWAPVVSFTTEAGFVSILIGMNVATPFLRWYLRTPAGNEAFGCYCRMDALAHGSAVALLIQKQSVVADRWRSINKLIDRSR